MEVKICPLMMAFSKATRDWRCCRGLCSWWNAEKQQCAVPVLAELASNASVLANNIAEFQSKEGT